MRGFLFGVTVQNFYNYIQNSLTDTDSNKGSSKIKRLIGTKIKQYDTNHDGNITVGEIIDGTIRDLKHFETKSTVEVDPTVLFTVTVKDNNNCNKD